MIEKLSTTRLSTRIVASAIVIVVACGFMLMYIENTRLRDTYLAEERTRVEEKLHAGKLQLIHITNELRNDVLFLSETPPVSGIMRAALNRGLDPRYGYSSKIWEERLQQIFSAFSAAHPEYYQIRYIGIANKGRELVRIDNRKGNIEITADSGLQAKGDRDYFKAALGLHAGEVYLSEFNLNREHGVIEKPHRPTLRAVTPVFAPSGQMFGMIVINMDAARLLESITRDVPVGFLPYISNMAGEYLFHPDPSLSFSFEAGGKGSIIEDFPPIKKVFDLRESEHLPMHTAELKSGAQYLAAERVHFDSGKPSRFLLLAYLMPEAELARQVATTPARNVAGVIAVMLLIGVIALLVLRRMFAPLEQLTQAAEAIASGNRDVLLPKSGSGEIAGLAHAFGIMLDKLSLHEQEVIRNNQQLEKRVEERTTELQQAKQEIEAAYLLHKAVIGTAIDGFWITDANDNLVEANEAYANMSGYSLSELKGMHISQLEAIEKPQDVAAHRALIVKQGYDRFETRHRHKDGHEIDVEISVTYLAGTQQFSGFCRDITRRKKSEEALRIAAAAFETQDAIAITNADGIVTRVNNALSVITGYNPDEVLGKSLAMIFQGYSLQSEQKNQPDDGLYAGELFARRKNGETYPVWLTITAVRNDLQKITHHVVIFSDITARKLAEEKKRRESEERFRGTLEQAAVGIAHASLEGYFQHVNQKFCDIVGYERDELLRMSFRDITFPEDLDENNRYLKQLLAGKIPTFSLEKRYIRKDKNLIWVNLTVSALRDDNDIPKYTIGVIEDITERKHSEAFLQQFAGLLENSFNEIYVFDSDKCCFLLTSEGAESNLGYSPEELYQLTPGDICPSLAGDSLVQVAALLESGMQKSLSMDTIFRRKNGTVYPVELRMQYMKSEFPVFMIVAQDVTERKRNEMALKASAKKHRMLFESSRDALMLLAPPLWQFTAANYATLQLFGVSSEAEFTALGPWNVSPKWQPDGRLSKEKALEMIMIAMREGSHFFQWEHQKIGGQAFTADVLLTRMEAEEEEEEEFLLASVRDVTERNRWQQQLRSLTGHIQTVREEEKASIAREIHDHLGSTLTALKMDIYWLTEEIQANKGKSHLLGHIGSMSQLLDNAVDVTRRVITDLRPTMLDELGLHAALEWQAGQFQKRTGIQCRVINNCHEQCKSILDKTQAINLFRIAQESLTNIARHSGAAEAEIELMCDDGEIILTISDNGRGIQEGHVFSRTSYGMLGMRERAGQMGGRISFYCPPDGGFSVTVVMPLQNVRQSEVRL